MANPRKTAATRKPAKPTRSAAGAKKAAARPAKASRSAAPPKKSAPAHRPAAKAPAAKSVKPAAKAPAKVVARGGAPSLPKAAKPALKALPSVKGGKAAAAPAVKKGSVAVAAASSKKTAVKGRIVLVKRSPTPDPQVRPLGVLPPESRARVPDRSPAPSSQMNRTSVVRRKPDSTRTQGADRVSDSDLKQFEGRLLAERERLMREMGHLESTIKVNQRDSSGDLSGYSFHMADAGTDAIEREKAFMFASAEGRMLLEIKDALGRLYRGEYGVCESCQKPIARARLEAMPYARLCVSCKEKEEKASRGAM